MLGKRFLWVLFEFFRKDVEDKVEKEAGRSEEDILCPKLRQKLFKLSQIRQEQFAKRGQGPLLPELDWPRGLRDFFQ